MSQIPYRAELARLEEIEKKARRDIAHFEKTIWFIPVTIAIFLDTIADLFTAIPIIGIIFAFLVLPLTIYMIIFNFRFGALRAKIIRFLILLIDFIPIISMIWFGNVFVIFLMWNHARRKRNKAKKLLGKIEQEKQRIFYYMYNMAV